MIMKFLNFVYSKIKRRRRKKLLIRKLEEQCFSYRYGLINLCLTYSSKGLKQGRFLYRVNKNVRLLQRRELQLKRLRNK